MRAPISSALMSSVLVASVLVTLVPAAPVGAQDVPVESAALEARVLFEEGVRMSRAERWSEALDFFRRSRALVPRPSTLFNMAIALDRLGRLQASIAAIDEYVSISDPVADEVDRREAMRLRVEAEARLARLVVAITPPDARLELDGVPVPGEGSERALPVDPGDHVLVAAAEGFVEERLALSLPPAAQVERRIDLEPIAQVVPEVASVVVETSPVPPRRTEFFEDPVFWAIAGGLVAAIGIGIGLGVYEATAPQQYGGTTGIVIDIP